VRSPKLITEKLMAVQEKFPGLGQINVACTSMATPEKETLEELEWFGTEIMPTTGRLRHLPRPISCLAQGPDKLYILYTLAALPPAILALSSSVQSTRISSRISRLLGKVDSVWG